MANDPIQAILNAIIKNMLPQINGAIKGAITSNHLDPWGHVAGATDNLGHINLGICTASASASYSVTNMRGLSGFSIDSIVINSSQAGPDGSITGDVSVAAHMSGNLSTGVSGKFSAGCGFIHPSVGISGTGTVSGLNAHANGTYTATSKGGQVCLTGLDVRTLNIDYSGVDVNINGLGIFNSLLGPLVDAITGLFNGQIKGAIASAVTPLIDSEIAKALPQCKSL